MILLCFCALFLMGFAVAMPKDAASAVRQALSLLSGAVIPNLILFSMAAKLLILSGAPTAMARHFPKALGRGLGISPYGLAAVFVGLTAGFPMGAMALSDMVKGGRMAEEEAASLLPFCNNAGAAFVIGTAGEAFFGDAALGALLLAAQTAAALTALLLTAKERHPEGAAGEAPRMSVSRILISAISGGVYAMLAVSGYVIFFSVLSEAAGRVLSLVSTVPAPVIAILSGIMEISGGLFSLAKAGAPRTVALLVAALLLGFGGISVYMQVSDAAEQAGIRTLSYMRGKGQMSFLCAAYTLLFVGIKEGHPMGIVAFAALLLTVFFSFIKIRGFLKKGVEKGKKLW